MKGQMTRLAIFFICIIVFEVLDWVFDVKSDFIKEKRLPIVWKYDFGKRFLQYVMRFTFR